MSLIDRCTNEGGIILDDMELIKQLKQGDTSAYEKLFDKYYAQAMRTAYLITGNKHTSEDIVQETFIQCFRSISSLKNPAFFKGWFFKTLTRIAWRHSNKNKKIIPVDDIFEIAQEQTTNQVSEEFYQDEESKVLYDAIESLDNKLRTTIILYYFNDLSIKEVAKATGCFEGTVKSRLHTARKSLKEHLLKDFSCLSIIQKERENHEVFKTV